MKEALREYCDKRCAEFDEISEERKITLSKIAAYIKYKELNPIKLLFVSYHNSRRSILGQIWAKVASNYFGFVNIETYSGGIESTSFHGNIELALLYIGFDMTVEGDNENAIHRLIFDNVQNASVCFSKFVEDVANPDESFGTIVTCEVAENKRLNINGSELRIFLPYKNPLQSDGTDKQMENYLNTSKKIAREMLYLFSISR